MAVITPSAGSKPPIRLTGVLVAIVVLGVVMFIVPPVSRLWIAGVVLVMALLIKGGDTARVIDQLRVKVYGG